MTQSASEQGCGTNFLLGTAILERGSGVETRKKDELP